MISELEATKCIYYNSYYRERLDALNGRVMDDSFEEIEPSTIVSVLFLSPIRLNGNWEEVYCHFLDSIVIGLYLW